MPGVGSEGHGPGQLLRVRVPRCGGWPPGLQQGLEGDGAVPLGEAQPSVGPASVRHPHLGARWTFRGRPLPTDAAGVGGLLLAWPQPQPPGLREPLAFGIHQHRGRPSAQMCRSRSQQARPLCKELQRTTTHFSP